MCYNISEVIHFGKMQESLLILLPAVRGSLIIPEAQDHGTVRQLLTDGGTRCGEPFFSSGEQAAITSPPTNRNGGLV